MAKTPTAPTAGEFDNEYLTEEITLRGVNYKFRELSVGKYDELVKLATSKNDLGEELVDNALLVRLMVLESCIAPKLTADKLNKLGLRIGRRLNTVVQTLNWGSEPDGDEEKESDIQEGEPEAEGEG
jgi:hypothetical protein